MKNQLSLKLNTRNILIVILINLSFSSHVSAQLQMCTAKDKNYSSIAYQVGFNNDNRSLMEARGYDKLSCPPPNFDEEGLKMGYYVVVKSSRQESSGNNKYENISYGIGGSKTSYDVAEQLAVKNLATSDWGWTKKNSYEVVEKNSFVITNTNTSVIAIVFMSKDASGNKKITKATFQHKTLTDTEYTQLKSKFKTTNPNQEIKVSRLLVKEGKVAVVKCIKTVGNSTNETYKLVYASTGDNYNVALFTEGTLTQPNEAEKYILVNEMNIELENSNENQSVISNVKQKIRASQPKPNKNKKATNGGSGVRG